MPRQLRGRFLEFNLDKLIKVINNQGSFAYKFHPKRSQDGRFLEKPPFDYIIVHLGKTTCLDAKECQKDKWYLTGNAKAHQIKNLKNAKNNGADSFFLVYYYPSKKLIKLDVDVVIETNEKFLTVEDGEEFKHVDYTRNKI